MRRLLALAAAALTAGCAAIIEGQTQTITFDVLPRQAQCLASRAGLPLGTLTSTATTLTLRRAGDAIDLTCTAAGYRAEILKVDPSPAPLGVLTAPADFPIGTFWRYPERVVVTMYRE